MAAYPHLAGTLLAGLAWLAACTSAGPAAPSRAASASVPCAVHIWNATYRLPPQAITGRVSVLLR